MNGKATLAPPKRRKTRDVPLSTTVAEELSERIDQYPPGDGGLVFTTREGGPLTRSYYNRRIGRPALEAAGVERSRANGMHALRHYYTSALLSQGVSIRAVAAYLGHEDPGFTLRVYGHLMPDDDDRARAAVDVALGRRADQVRTSEAD
ncbi:MAG TPA: tyrosine-type recombinase/integrase [Euzebyales bacterium]|nr:tyrosine-type recombinase/integrase [Euzebyales bacterium]